MKQVLYGFWAVVLFTFLGGGWMLIELMLNITPMSEIKSQVQHIDDWVNNRGVYGQR